MTMVNPSVTDARETEIALRGATAKSAKVTVLTAGEMNAHNTFESPDAVNPTTAEGRVTGGSVMLHGAAEGSGEGGNRTLITRNSPCGLRS